MSEINIMTSGKAKAKILLEMYNPPKSAMAVTGVKLGRCGTNLKSTATIINSTNTAVFLLR